jgi:hypothetical protein
MKEMKTIVLLILFAVLPMSLFAQMENRALAAGGYAAASAGVNGDVNNDGVVNVGDIMAVINLMAANSNAKKGDVNSDNKVNVGDIMAIINIMAAGPTGNTGCPDGNHPHKIDLGIGTKWACCNIGAGTPEDYGEYIAWAELREKNEYTMSSYQYYSNGRFTSLGDIAGTTYDVATARWHSPWHIPTLDQIKTLLDKCTMEWTQQKGVNGAKFTGPNGASIFLPAAGTRSDSDLRNKGLYGSYWSSIEDSRNTFNAYYLHIGEGFALWNCSDGRWYGFSIRPVAE